MYVMIIENKINNLVMDTTKIRFVLNKLGLNLKEQDCYLMLLFFGTAPASVIAKKVKMPRSTVQFTMQQLIKLELCTVIKRGNVYQYTIESPDKLIYLLEKKRQMINEQEESVQEILPDLYAIQNPHSFLPKVQYFEGQDGVMSLLLKMAASEGEIVTYSARDFYMKMNPEMVKQFQKKLTKLNPPQKVRIIRCATDKKQELNTINKQNKFFNRLKDLKVDIQITKDKISIASIDKNAPVGVLIQHKQIAAAFYQIFDELWHNLK